MQVADAAVTIIVTLSTIFVLGMAVGFGVLFRRGRRSGTAVTGTPDRLQVAAQRASVLLVKADDAVRDASDELDFAVAQFGAERTRPLEAALATARRQVMEAFELQQRLDDHIPDSEAQRRDWTARVAHLSETAQSRLAEELARLDALRRGERGAPETLAGLRRTLDGLEARRPEVASVLAQLQARFSSAAVASVADSVERASADIAAGRRAADAAAPAIEASVPDSAAVVAALDTVREGEEHARRASHLLDAVEVLRAQLGEATAALEERIAAARADVAQARALSDQATDAAASAPVLRAIDGVESALAALDASDPVHALDRLQQATHALDAAMASARNQEQRLAQAREALAGALVAARSQVSSTRDYIEGRRSGIGREARTRLAEAERLLTVAAAEADPVLALDTARSAATYARDADALARYDIQH